MIFQILRQMLISYIKIPYFTLVNYSPRGDSDLSVKSRQICGNIKAGREGTILHAINYLKSFENEELTHYFNKNVTLIPIPRSAPLSIGALWPTKVIAELFLKEGFAKEVMPCIERVNPVRKSSFQTKADSRPSVEEHYDSLSVTPVLLVPDQITLIDDVLTLGRTTFACVQRLNETFPKTEIRIFALVRTQSLIPNIEKIIDPSFGVISYSSATGKTSRNP